MEILIFIVVGAIVMFFWIKGKISGHDKAQFLEGDGTYSLEVVGESYYQDALSKICGGKGEDGARYSTEATLVLENDNQYDKNAVAVEIDGLKVGHLSKNYAKKYRSHLKKEGLPMVDHDCKALIVGGWKDEEYEGNFGVRLDLIIN